LYRTNDIVLLTGYISCLLNTNLDVLLGQELEQYYCIGVYYIRDPFVTINAYLTNFESRDKVHPASVGWLISFLAITSFE
jgi:hypothetical protein